MSASSNKSSKEEKKHGKGSKKEPTKVLLVDEKTGKKIWVYNTRHNKLSIDARNRKRAANDGEYDSHNSEKNSHKSQEDESLYKSDMRETASGLYEVTLNTGELKYYKTKERAQKVVKTENRREDLEKKFAEKHSYHSPFDKIRAKNDWEYDVSSVPGLDSLEAIWHVESIHGLTIDRKRLPDIKMNKKGEFDINGKFKTLESYWVSKQAYDGVLVEDYEKKTLVEIVDKDSIRRFMEVEPARRIPTYIPYLFGSDSDAGTYGRYISDTSKASPFKRAA